MGAFAILKIFEFVIVVLVGLVNSLRSENNIFVQNILGSTVSI